MASYENPKDAKNNLEKLGFTYDNELLSPDSKVFLDKRGRPNIAFRGSKRIEDILPDLALTFGLEKYDKRFQEAKHLTQLVETKYNQPANVYGHSLAGQLAEKSGANGKIITYNKGTGVMDIGKTIPQNQIDYHNKNDVVSLLSLTQPHPYNNLREHDTSKGAFDIIGNHII